MILNDNARRRVPAALATLVASGALAACGSSSGSSSTSTSASGSTSGNNRAAFIACLKQHGVTPPGGGNGGRPPGAGNGGRPPAQSGSGNSARRAAFKACGATGRFGGGSSSQSTQK